MYAIRSYYDITTLHNRVNELGTSEPVIQQQGIDRVVVQLPGVQDTARAKDIIGRTASLEIRITSYNVCYTKLLRTQMPAFGEQFTREEVWHLVNYVRRLSAQASQPD